MLSLFLHFRVPFCHLCLHHIDSSIRELKKPDASELHTITRPNNQNYNPKGQH